MTFWASGSDQEVVDFFAELAERLQSLPVDRLETEAGVLSAEADGRTCQSTDPTSGIMSAITYQSSPSFGVQ